MSRRNKIGLFASLFALIGIPLIFLIMTLYSGDWRFFVYSIGPGLSSGFLGLRRKSKLTIFYGGVTLFTPIFYLVDGVTFWPFIPAIALIILLLECNTRRIHLIILFTNESILQN